MICETEGEWRKLAHQPCHFIPICWNLPQSAEQYYYKWVITNSQYPEHCGSCRLRPLQLNVPLSVNKHIINTIKGHDFGNWEHSLLYTSQPQWFMSYSIWTLSSFCSSTQYYLKRLNILNKTDTEFHICKCLYDASPIKNYLKLYYLLQTLSKFPLEHSIFW